MLHGYKLYSALAMDSTYQIEQRDPFHHWAPQLNKELIKYKQALKQEDVNESLFFTWVEQQYPLLEKTQYLTAEELEALRQKFEGNTLVNAATGARNEKGMHMFVMTEQGEFYLRPKVRPAPGKPGFNHSSFFGGAPVSGVGFLHFDENGVLVAIDNYSGHYKPQKEQVLNAMFVLQARGIDLSKVRYEHRIDPTKTDKQIFNAKAWFDANVTPEMMAQLHTQMQLESETVQKSRLSSSA